MKKTSILALVIGLGLAANVHAFGLPKVSTGNSTLNSVANSAVDMGKNKVIEDQINKDIRKQNCSFKKNSSETTCNLHGVISSINNKKSALQAAGLINNVTINVVAHGPNKGNLMSERNDNVYNALWSQLSWTSYNKATNKDGTDGLDISVSVR